MRASVQREKSDHKKDSQINFWKDDIDDREWRELRRGSYRATALDRRLCKPDQLRSDSDSVVKGKRNERPVARRESTMKHFILSNKWENYQ